MAFLRDESGKRSSARLAFWCLFLIVNVLIIIATFHPNTVRIPDPAFALFGETMLALIGWAGGPRVMKYIGPQLGAVAAGISAAVKGERPKYRNIRSDDEEDR